MSHSAAVAATLKHHHHPDINNGHGDQPGDINEHEKIREERAQTSARAEHGRSGDPGLGARNKEQWADRRVMTAKTRLRGQRSVSRWDTLELALEHQRAHEEARSSKNAIIRIFEQHDTDHQGTLLPTWFQ